MRMRQREGGHQNNKLEEKEKSIAVRDTRMRCHTATCRPKFRASERSSITLFYCSNGGLTFGDKQVIRVKR